MSGWTPASPPHFLLASSSSDFLQQVSPHVFPGTRASEKCTSGNTPLVVCSAAWTPLSLLFSCAFSASAFSNAFSSAFSSAFSKAQYAPQACLVAERLLWTEDAEAMRSERIFCSILGWWCMRRIYIDHLLAKQQQAGCPP